MGSYKKSSVLQEFPVLEETTDKPVLCRRGQMVVRGPGEADLPTAHGPGCSLLRDRGGPAVTPTGHSWCLMAKDHFT